MPSVKGSLQCGVLTIYGTRACSGSVRWLVACRSGSNKVKPFHATQHDQDGSQAVMGPICQACAPCLGEIITNLGIIEPLACSRGGREPAQRLSSICTLFCIVLVEIIKSQGS